MNTTLEECPVLNADNATPAPLPYEPMWDNVLMEEVVVERKSDDGLIVQQDAETAEVYGRVLAVGPGHYLNNGELAKPRLEIGDVVILHRSKIMWLNEFSKKKYLLVPERLIHAKKIL